MELSGFTSIRVGGKADYFAKPRNLAEIRDLVAFAQDKDLPLYILGGGSNTIFGDIKGLVLSTSSLRGLKVTEKNGSFLVEARAGTPLKELIAFSVKENLQGLYKLLGFPASVGGAVSMNAGAFGVEISSFLREVSFMDWEGRLHRVKAEELTFSYRSSPFPSTGIVLSCLFELRKSENPVVEDYRRIRDRRKVSQPINMPTSGSTFKNPYPNYAGELLERVGLKGYRVGEVSFSEKHANFLVNHGGGSFGDVVRLIEEAKRRVREEFGILLEEEVRLVEDSGSDGWKVL